MKRRTFLKGLGIIGASLSVGSIPVSPFPKEKTAINAITVQVQGVISPNEFVEATLRAIASAMEVPYDLLVKDYQT